MEDSISFSFGGRTRTFHVLNIPNNNIRQFQKARESVASYSLYSAYPLGPLGEGVASMFEGDRELRRVNLIRRLELQVDGNGNVFVADTGNGRIEKFSSTGAF